MPRIYALSDLHSEFYKEGAVPLPDVPADICVLAGDAGNVCGEGGPKLVRVLEQLRARYEAVVMCAGNHELFGSAYDYDGTLERLRGICDRVGITFLDRSEATIAGIRFVGATLWSNINAAGWLAINDKAHVFRSIKDYKAAHERDLAYLRGALTADSPSTVVLTHHLPTTKLIHPRFQSFGAANSAFATDVLDQLDLTRVPLFFCGHSHEASEYVSGKTRFVLNPLGYKDERRVTHVSLGTYVVEAE